MLRTVLVVLIIGGIAARGQTQKNTPAVAAKTERVDKAAAYYYYAVAHMYAEMAATSSDRNPEYASKAAENYKAAVKADPKAPPLLRELFPVPISIYPRLPVSRP